MKPPHSTCKPDDHPSPPTLSSEVTETARERAAQLFRAMGDVARLRTLELLARGELCVTDIVAASSEKFSTVSQRLRTLRNERLVVRRREGTHLFYALADR